MSDWDDLFSAAAGADEDAGPDASKSQMQTNPRKHHQVSGDDFDSTTEKRPSKKKKTNTATQQQHGTRTKSHAHEPLEGILKSRTDPISEQVWSKIPAWLSPGASLCNQALCSRGWKQKEDCLLDAKCKHCKLSVLHHSLSVTSSMALALGPAGKVLEAFTLVRDIRCCSSSILNEAYAYGYGCSNSNGNSEGNQTRKPNFEDYAMTAFEKSDRLVDMNFNSILSPGEADILIGKFNEVAKSARALRDKMKSWWCWTKGEQKQGKDQYNFKLRGIFDEIVQLMIDCDGAYFRLYYLQNAGCLPIQNDIAFLPHPPTYFESQNVTWNAGTDYATELANSMKKSCTNISDERWRNLMQDLGVNQNQASNELDSLSFMHKNRLSESIFIFHKSGWIHSEEAKNQTMQSMKRKSKPRDREDAFYIKYETPAPPIVKEWRDSCRDLLCNLYAYATLSPRIIEGIKTTLGKDSIACDNVLEMGAGTGYIAHLLSEAGLNVSAFDIAPTKPRYGQHNGSDTATANEYHGSSPPFCDVGSVDSKNLRSILAKREAKKTALLLCYPPPLSGMAEDALKSFVNRGGKTVILIGEFAGLTGSLHFENLLRHRFDLKHRAPCLHWGTDAAEVTIWSKSSEESLLGKSCPGVLAQCSQCENTSAASRCRLSRPLSYCSSSCFDAHKDEREIHFAFNMIPMDINTNEMISFHGSGRQHFEPISW
jgi:hypothetical protein